MPPRVKDAIARTGFSVEAIRSPRRTRQVVSKRLALYAELHDMGFSYPKIGQWLNRDHSTVIKGEQRHRARQASS